VTLNLIWSIAVPCLLYASEALPLTRANLIVLEHPWSRVFMKIFGTFDNNTVRYCQYYTRYMPLEHTARIRKVNFVRALKDSPCGILQQLHWYVSDNELRPIASFYNVTLSQLYSRNIKCIAEEYWSQVINDGIG
jgi:hypothetical protein